MRIVQSWLPAALAIAVIVALSSAFFPTQVLAADYLPGQTASGATEAWYGTCNHIVRPGETLAMLARRYGTTVYGLAQSNYLSNPNYIWSGMALRVPCTTGGYGNPYYGNPYGYRNPYSYGSPPIYRNPYSSYRSPYSYPSPYPQPAPMPAPQGGQVMVVMQNLAFNPATITVRVGQQVVWVNNDSVPHTTTSGSCSGNTCTPGPGWDSGTLNPGQSFAFTFSAVGTFTYFCRIHGAMMQGTVVVMQ